MTLFGKYELLEPIASGGMAEVFRATQRGAAGFERILAIKRILPHLNENRDFVDMFVDEAKIAVQLSHANIAQVFDLGCVDGTYYIALEFVHGRDLRALNAREHDRHDSVPVDIACYITMRVAAALHHAHQALGRDGNPLGVIHRDVSPQNVLVSFEGDVKVIDFGLAKAAGRATQTQVGVVKGKLAYLSPEQTLGAEIDHRSDIFALGICFFELLTGQRLFLRGNDLDTVMAVRKGDVPDPSRLCDAVPKSLSAIVLRALADDPAGRHQTAMELHDAVEEHLYQSGQIVTRRRVADYMRRLFPVESVPPGQARPVSAIMDFSDTTTRDDLPGDNQPLEPSDFDDSTSVESVPAPEGIAAEGTTEIDLDDLEEDTPTRRLAMRDVSKKRKP